MNAKCKVCKLDWNISSKADITYGYVCPNCEEKSRKRNGIVTNVLIKNKAKFEGGIKL